MEVETLLREFEKRGIFLERGISIKYTKDYSLFSYTSSGNISYTTQEGDTEVILQIYNDVVEDIQTSGPQARRIEAVYKEIEEKFFNLGPARGFSIF